MLAAKEKLITARQVPLNKKGTWEKICRNYVLYLFLLPTIVAIFIFHYMPLYGIQLAFKDFLASKGIWGSPWVGLYNFNRLFHSPQFWIILKNTLGISIYQLVMGFPIPIIFALALNYAVNERLKKTVQLVTYAPHFISTVVMVGILNVMLSPTNGPVNIFIKALGMDPVLFMGKPELFKSIYVWSGIWQSMGWNSIIYIAALSGVSYELHEAAIIDGATKLQRMCHVDLPSIMPTAVVLLILAAGSVMNVGFEKVYLMQNTLNLSASETIPTYVYKVGLLSADYSYSTAVGLFNNVVNFILLLSVNKAAKIMGETSLF